MREPTRGKTAGYAVLTLIVTLMGGAVTAAERPALRVCADPNNPPFSNKEQAGFENRVASILAQELGIAVEYTWFPQRRGFIRNTLKAPHPDREGFKCDLIMGVPDGMERVITTAPYYHSTYALVYAKDGPLDGITSGQDFNNLDAAVRDGLKVGVFEQTPGAAWLARYNLHEQMVGYATLGGDPDEYPGKIIERDLAAGKLDAAIVWGPVAGYFAEAVTEPRLTMVPLPSEQGIKFDFAISAAVRYGEGEWKDEIELLMKKKADSIRTVLKEFNVPLVE